MEPETKPIINFGKTVIIPRKNTIAQNGPLPNPFLIPLPNATAATTTTMDNATKKKRATPCPRGTRKNPKTGNCDPYVPKIAAAQLQPVQSIIKTPPIELPPVQSIIKTPPIELPPVILEKEGINIQPSPNLGQQKSILDTEVVQDLEKQSPIDSLVRPKDPKKIILDNLLPTVREGSNEYLRQKEKIEFDTRSEQNDYPFLYPDLDDPHFALKIAKRKEFNDTKYDGTIHSVQEQADKMCGAEFELLPHQIFVKNFLSFNTPYNSLLLYHGLGSGKTCSAIGIAEEMRAYMKQVGIKQRIIVVAAPNVQANFRLQLFDERRLFEVDGMWTIHSCIGDALIREINPTSLKGMPKERVINQIKTIINQYYVFMGYVELANFISKKTALPENSGFTPEEQKKMEIQNIKRVFNNRLIIIDEVHNIRMTDENKDWKTAQGLMKLAKYCSNMRLLMLSATPMYNSNKEIIWLTNLMNMNDKRGTITAEEIFDKNGEFKTAEKSADGKVVKEDGRELLHRKLIGYVSYIRGENPYTFPYRIYPNDFSPAHTFVEPGSIIGSLAQAVGIIGGPAVPAPKQFRLPTLQLNGKPIDEPLIHLPVYVNQIGSYQEKAYRLVINTMRQETNRGSNAFEIPTFENMDRFGFRRLQTPLEALNIVYPSEALDAYIARNSLLEAGSEPSSVNSSVSEDEEEDDEDQSPMTSMVGKRGMRSVMNYIDDSKKKIPMKYGFEYKPEILAKYGRIFNLQILSTYSAKMARICEIIKKSTGIVLIYSQYIDGGVVPMALALEEMGFTRYGSAANTRPLFATPPTEPLDALTMKPRSQLPAGTNFQQAKYVMITGDKAFSPHNADEIKNVTGHENKNGEIVKVIIISKAGSEGLDFKCIRQIHIIEPWYNLNRIEQIVGRGVRNLSHCMLRNFGDRNVEIYMHSTYLRTTPNEEAADVYVYRLAKKKADQIGKVTRLIKETAVDCLLNIGQSGFTVDKINARAENQNIELTLSTSKKKLKYKIGDRPHTDICDYMDNCDMKCSPDMAISGPIVQDTYSTVFANANNTRLMQRIRQLFRDANHGQHFFDFNDLVTHINITKQYPIDQIYSALTAFIKNKNEFLVDKYGRRGNLINRGKIYAFQPIEINDEAITVFERTVPIDVKRETLNLEVRKEFPIDQDQDQGKGNGSPKTPRTPRAALNMEDAYIRIMQDFEIKLNEATTEQIVNQGDRNWYKHFSLIVNHLQIVRELTFEDITDHLIRHMVDVLLPADKLVLITHFYSKIRDEGAMDEIEMVVKKYLDTKMVSVGNNTGFFLAENTNWKIYVPRPDPAMADKIKWIEAEPEDVREFERAGELNKFRVDPSLFSHIIGFINMFKTGKEMVFRIKDITQKQNNTGTRMDAQIKADVIKRLNSVLGENTYTVEKSKEILQLGMCAILEMVLRQRTQEQFEDKVWYLTPEQAMYSGITKYQRK